MSQVHYWITHILLSVWMVCNLFDCTLNVYIASAFSPRNSGKLIMMFFARSSCFPFSFIYLIEWYSTICFLIWVTCFLNPCSFSLKYFDWMSFLAHLNIWEFNICKSSLLIFYESSILESFYILDLELWSDSLIEIFRIDYKISRFITFKTKETSAGAKWVSIGSEHRSAEWTTRWQRKSKYRSPFAWY